ncbi:conserved oligomeric Golgi complex subunit 5 [Ischnura elegans]|uniref:conserved oligomeric Golgi complex subunit 5 n=1 Tax=Ischnura elegans TaxID=197161 RepID=UPI001ED8B30A|nr:conserved oligomeric Golgi complex subunit 5 [Ischnura elegans]
MGELNVWKKLEEDEFLRVFIDGEFDVKNAQHLTKGIAVPDQISKLSEGILLLDQELRYQIMNHYEDLLSQATWVEKLEGVLNIMQSHMQNLLSSIERLRAQVVEPYRRVEIQTLVLGRLQETCDTLRRIFRALLLSKRLQSHIAGGTPELVRAAQCIGEIEQVWGEADLSGIDIVDKHQRAGRIQRADIERQAKFMLGQGLKSQNESQVCTALEVYANLGLHGQALQQAAESARQSVAAAVRDNLDVRNFTQPTISSSQSDSTSRSSKGGPGRAMIPTAGSRASLWSSLEKMLLELIYSQCCQIALLHRCGTAASSSLFRSGRLKEKPPSPCTLEEFWNYTTSLLSRELTSAANSSAFIKQALENEFPKFLRLYLDLWRRLCVLQQTNDPGLDFHSNIFSSGHPAGTSEVACNGIDVKREVVEPFETAYLTSSMSRLYDPVEGMFVGEGGGGGKVGGVVVRSGSVPPVGNGVGGSGPTAESLSGEAANVPAPDKLDSFVSTITRELSVSLVDVVLSRKVARNVKNALKLFCAKCEQSAAHGASATQVIEAFTPAQNLNATLVNLLCYLNGEVHRVIANIGGPPIASSVTMTLPSSSSGLMEEASSLVLGALSDSKSLAANILQPLLDSVSEAIKAIIYTIHNEDFSGETLPDKKRNTQGASPYMKELQRFLSRVASDYLSKYNCQELILECVLPVVERCLHLFMRHACLVRPVGAGGRAKLASDFTQVEIAVEPLLSCGFAPQRRDLSSIETKYPNLFHTLRSLRPIILSSEIPPIEELTNPDSPVPPSLVMFSLFARGPSELLSPYQSMNWSVERLSKWLDAHGSERDRLEIARGSLERYESEVRQRGEKQFHPVYPIMVTVLQEGVAKTNM